MLGDMAHIPLDRITGTSADKPKSEWGQIRAPGTHIPFLVKAGTYHGGQSKEFYYTTAGMPHLVIETMAWDFNRIVLTISDNQAWVERIQKAIKSTT